MLFFPPFCRYCGDHFALAFLADFRAVQGALGARQRGVPRGLVLRVRLLRPLRHARVHLRLGLAKQEDDKCGAAVWACVCAAAAAAAAAGAVVLGRRAQRLPVRRQRGADDVDHAPRREKGTRAVRCGSALCVFVCLCAYACACAGCVGGLYFSFFFCRTRSQKGQTKVTLPPTPLRHTHTHTRTGAQRPRRRVLLQR